MSTRFSRTDTGINTVEGNVAGGRAGKLTKQREKAQEKFLEEKNKIQNDRRRLTMKIDDKFSTECLQNNDEFKQRTVGLVTAEQFKQAALESRLKEEEEAKEKQGEEEEEVSQPKKKKRRRKNRIVKTALSFDVDEEEEEGGDGGGGYVVPTRVMKKDPHIDTSYLPDMFLFQPIIYLI